MLATPLEQLAFIIAKAREFDAETAPVAEPHRIEMRNRAALVAIGEA
jgi:hypothetical protein